VSVSAENHVTNTGPEVAPTDGYDHRWWGWQRLPLLTTGIGWLLAWVVATRGTLSPLTEWPYIHGTTWFYREQLQAILEGRLYVTTGLLTDCYDWQGHCYGYFGITPSLLRLPLLALPWEASWSPLMVWLAAAAGIACSVAIVVLCWQLLGRWPQRHVRTPDTLGTRITFTLALIIVSVGSPLLLDLTRTVYQEAVAWGAAFVLAACALFLRWWLSPHWGYALGMVVALVAASNARVGTLVVGVPLAVAFLLVDRSRPRPPARAISLIWAGAIALLPIVGALGVFYLKFGVLIPSIELNVYYPETPVLGEALAAAGGHLSSPVFLTTMAWAYLRPDSLVFDPAAPLGMVPRETFTLLWPTPAGSVVMEQAPGVVALTPVAAVLTVIAVAWMLRGTIAGTLAPDGTRSRMPGAIWLALTGAAAAPTAAILTFHYLVLRYTMDFTPLLVLGVAVGSAVLITSRPGSAPWRTTSCIAAIAGTLWTVIAVNAVGLDAAQPLHVPRFLPAPTVAMQARGHLCPHPSQVPALGAAGVSPACAIAIASYADPQANAVLATSIEPQARAVIATLADEPLLRQLAADPAGQVRVAVAGRERTPQDVLATLAQDADPTVRAAVARNPQTSVLILVALFADVDPEVAATARANPGAP